MPALPCQGWEHTVGSVRGRVRIMERTGKAKWDGRKRMRSRNLETWACCWKGCCYWGDVKMGCVSAVCRNGSHGSHPLMTVIIGNRRIPGAGEIYYVNLLCSKVRVPYAGILSMCYALQGSRKETEIEGLFSWQCIGYVSIFRQNHHYSSSHRPNNKEDRKVCTEVVTHCSLLLMTCFGLCHITRQYLNTLLSSCFLLIHRTHGVLATENWIRNINK